MMAGPLGAAVPVAFPAASPTIVLQSATSDAAVRRSIDASGRSVLEVVGGLTALVVTGAMLRRRRGLQEVVS